MKNKDLAIELIKIIEVFYLRVLEGNAEAALGIRNNQEKNSIDYATFDAMQSVNKTNASWLRSGLEAFMKDHNIDLDLDDPKLGYEWNEENNTINPELDGDGS